MVGKLFDRLLFNWSRSSSVNVDLEMIEFDWNLFRIDWIRFSWIWERLGAVLSDLKVFKVGW